MSRDSTITNGAADPVEKDLENEEEVAELKAELLVLEEELVGLEGEEKAAKELEITEKEAAIKAKEEEAAPVPIETVLMPASSGASLHTVIVKNPKTNEGAIYLGKTGSASEKEGFPLDPGESVPLDVKNAQQMSFTSTKKEEGPRWIGVSP